MLFADSFLKIDNSLVLMEALQSVCSRDYCSRDYCSRVQEVTIKFVEVDREKVDRNRDSTINNN